MNNRHDQTMDSDKMPQMVGELQPFSTVVQQSNSELPAMVDAARDILIASMQEALDIEIYGEVIEEAKQFLITVFREKREHVEKLKPWVKSDDQQA